MQSLRSVTRVAARQPQRSQMLSPVGRRAFADKKDDLMDKDSMMPQSSEFSKTGSDADAAQEDVAFDGGKTDPDEQTAAAGQKPKGDSQNPLNVSPGNTETRAFTPPGKDDKVERSQTESEGGRKSSGGGSTPKGRAGVK